MLTSAKTELGLRNYLEKTGQQIGVKKYSSNLNYFFSGETVGKSKDAGRRTHQRNVSHQYNIVLSVVLPIPLHKDKEFSEGSIQWI